MSAHYFPAVLSDGSRCKVTVGWDRPLQGFFMVIERCDCDDDDDLFPYSNLRDLDLLSTFGMSSELSYFVEKAKEFGVDIPKPVQQAVERDGEVNAGNFFVSYTAHGEVLQQE